MGDLLKSSEHALDNRKQLLKPTIELLKSEISLQTAIKVADLREKDLFENYGMDSVIVMDITKRLEERIGHLSKTLFFEFDSIEELAHYLIQIKTKELTQLFGLDSIDEMDHNQIEEKMEHKWNGIFKNQIRKKNSSKIEKKEFLSQNHIRNVMEDDIAIIGISGKYPMADNLDEFWENLKNGRDCITKIPENRWNHSLYYSEDKHELGKSYGKWGGFLNDVDKFDPLFFHMTPLEADFIDPQERLFLEETYHAIEDAGYSRTSLDNSRTGVFVGVMFGLYQMIENKEYGVKITGRNNFASIANRVSYFFNFHGPSIALDTMCSSSLTALYLACNSIRNKEIDMAIVGGVNLSLHPNKYVQLSQGGFLSTDGRCRSFGADGDGYVPGEGVGSMLIKPLQKAIEDGDHIYSVIKGIGINAGGKTQGYTVPNPNAQYDLIKDVLNKGNINPETISYVEAHGTGTALGDPIEINAITNAYRQYTDKKQFCRIGSVKSNIGHTESAAGMASITKVILQMKHHQLVPSIHSDILNPYIDFEDTPFQVQHDLIPWEPSCRTGGNETASIPRRAAISAFGAGGANAHLILEEYVPEYNNSKENERKQRLFLLSAKNKTRLKQSAQALLQFLKQSEGQQEKEEESDSIVSQDMILDRIKTSVDSILKIGVNNINNWMSMCEFGFGEYEMKAIATKLQAECGYNLTTELFLTHPTLEALSHYLYNQIKPKQKESINQESLLLDDLEYTLQVGREHMQQRLSIIAEDKDSLMDALTQYINGNTDGRFVREGNIEDFADKFDAILHSDLIEHQREKLVEEWNVEQISELWIVGGALDFSAYYETHKRQRISLPTYPFEKMRCWVTAETPGTPLVVDDGGVVEHTNQIPEKTLQHGVEAKPFDKSGVSKPANKITVAEINQYTVEFLIDVFATVLKISKEHLSVNTDFENYGLDSIYVKSINQYLEGIFGTLPATLLFTYKNMKTLANYFVTNHRKTLILMMTRESNVEEMQQETTHMPMEIQETVKEKEVIDSLVGCDEVAIIGISGRMPQSTDLEDFFEQLKAGKDFITEIPKERWNYEEYPEIKGHYGSFLTDVDKFDPQFFNISPMAAKFMDPQERIMIQNVWSCLEDAGYTPKNMENKEDEEDTRGSVSVYIGTTFNEYGLYGAQDHVKGINLPLNSQIYSMANRISYLFNFGGPSLTVDTACSSSLYAVHLACESIRSGECNMAIAGGINLSLHPSKYVTLNWGGFLAEDGHCRTFGEGGTGYVPGEGCAAVLLKPLQQAKADGDHIYGIIKGSAVNHGGKTYGYSVPNPTAQAQVIKKALKKAKVDPRTISYVEAHGTGTSLGDPIEIQALTEAYGSYTYDKQYCAIGSVKSNIGHLEAAAGISELVKVILQMKHKTLVPSRLNADCINKNLHFEDTPFYVQLEEQPWRRQVIGSQNQECKRRAGISAFGVGGVNVHMIVEEYEMENEQRETVAGDVLIPISSKTETNLRNYIEKYIEWIDSAYEKGSTLPNLQDVSFTLMTGRIQLPYRVCFIANDYKELKKSMEQYLEQKDGEQIFKGTAYTCDEQGKPQPNEELIQIALQWVDGQISLENVKLNDRGRRTSLPTYPFVKETYWMYSREEEFEGKTIVQQEVKEQEEPILKKLGQAYESERMQLIINHIQHIFADLLGFTEGRIPDINEGYFSLGLESVATREAYSILEERFHVELNDQVFFNYPSICKTAEYIASLLDFDHLVQEGDKEEQEETSLVLSKKVYVRKEANVGKAKQNEKIICICSRQYKKIVSNGVFASKTTIHYADDFKQANGLLDQDCLPGRIEILDINMKENDIISFFEFIKVLQSKIQDNVIIEYYFLNKEGNYHCAKQSAVGGFLATLQMEDVRFVCKEIAVSAKLNDAKIKEIIKKEYRIAEYNNTVSYTEQGRYVQALIRLDGISGESRLKKGGVYLITGGLGGVGKIMAQYLCSRYEAKLILCGRKTEAQIDLSTLNQANGSVIYMQSDITNKEDVDKLVDRIRETYGHINGVIHSAGVIKDAKIMNKGSNEFLDVIKPKVDGTLYLDEALKEEKLDVFAVCSSIAAVFGNIGQADYCYANSFLNEFARVRNEKVKKKERFGHTVSISWPFWKNGGMKIDQYTEKWMKNKFGLILMENKIGVHLVEMMATTTEDAFHAMVGFSQKIISSFSICEDTTNHSESIEDNTEETIKADIEKLDFNELVCQLEQELID